MDLDRWDGTSDEVQQHGEPARVGPHPLLGSSELGKGNLPETLPLSFGIEKLVRMKPAPGVALCMGKVPWSMLRSGPFVPFTIIGGCSTDEGHANESIEIS